MVARERVRNPHVGKLLIHFVSIVKGGKRFSFLFSFSTTVAHFSSPRMWNHTTIRDEIVSKTQIEVVVTFLINFGSFGVYLIRSLKTIKMISCRLHRFTKRQPCSF